MAKSTHEYFPYLLDALIAMAQQYLQFTDEDGRVKLSHTFMTAGEKCLGVLEDLGLVREVEGCLYEWVEKDNNG